MADSTHTQVSTGQVSWWRDDEGYGVVASPLGPIEASFATIEGMTGFRRLAPGETVTMEISLFPEGADNSAAPGCVGFACRTARGSSLAPQVPETGSPATETFQSSLEIGLDRKG